MREAEQRRAAAPPDPPRPPSGRPEASRRTPAGGGSVWWLPLEQLLLPGLAQVRGGHRVVGWIGVVVAALAWVGAAVLAFLALTRPATVLGMVTREGPVGWLVLALVVLAALCLVYGVFTLWRAIAARAPVARVVVAALVTLVTVGQVAGFALAATTANSGRKLLEGSFPSRSAVARPSPGSSTQAAPLDPAADGTYTILLLGGDAGTGRTGLRPDSISVVVLDAATGETTLVGIPRNLERATFVEGSPLWGPYPDGYDCGDECLISFLYTYGSQHPELYPDTSAAAGDAGIAAMQDAVEGVTGLSLDYTVLIDMQGFADLIDAVGGVDVDVPETFLAQDGHTTFQAGRQHMSGAQALLYSRTRYDSDDYVRMTRQRQVQKAVLDQVDPIKLVTGFQSIAAAGSTYVKTTIPQEDLASLLEAAVKARDALVQEVELVPPDVDVVHPDIEAIRKTIADALS